MADDGKVKAPRQRIVRIGDRQIVTEGLPNSFWNDINHRAMTVSWPVFFTGSLTIFLSLNLLFALLYSFGTAPVANAEPGNIAALFFFSVETLATVGYGDMHPQSAYGHIVATAEIFTGMSLIAVTTGLIFSRFSRPRARFVFASKLAIGRHDGKPTLMLRLANARQNAVTGATAKLWLLMNETTAEGRNFRRFRELKLERGETPMFALSWTLFHVIEESSPLWQADASSLEAVNASFGVTVSGLDEQLQQELRARQSYVYGDIVWRAHFTDILTVRDDGSTHIDYTKLDDTEPDGTVGNTNKDR